MRRPLAARAGPAGACLVAACLLAPAGLMAQGVRPDAPAATTSGTRPAKLPTTAAATVSADWARRAAACVACHSGQGAASDAGYVPRIAGKPEGYLYRQLQNFRDGRRPQPAMARHLKNLDDAYLRGLAAYFAAQHPPYAPPTVAPTAEAVQRGRALVLHGDAARAVPACSSCHGERLMGQGTDVPGLLGLPAAYLSAQLGAWRTGVRRGPAPDCMATIARALPLEDIAAVSHWLASQPVPSATATVATATSATAADAAKAATAFPRDPRRPRPPLPCGALEP